MAESLDDFSQWLNKYLKELNIDELIFGSYIKGIVESEDRFNEKLESLQDLVKEIIEQEDGIDRICDEILTKWNHFKLNSDAKLLNLVRKTDIDEQLVNLLEKQNLTVTKVKEITEENRRIKEVILGKYSEVVETDDKGDGEEEYEEVDEGGEDVFCKNRNAQVVADAEKMKREQFKLESQMKKEKNKEDREKQKKEREEKKEKRKTQKGERRR